MPDKLGATLLFELPDLLTEKDRTLGIGGIAKIADVSTLVANLRKLGAADKRVWIDPANRLVFAYEEDKLSIFFPTGVVPQAIAEKMPAGDRDADED